MHIFGRQQSADLSDAADGGFAVVGAGNDVERGAASLDIRVQEAGDLLRRAVRRIPFERLEGI
jgi:hypothetical protein